VKYQCLKSNNCKQDDVDFCTKSVSTHFKKLTTGTDVFIVSVIVYSNTHIQQFLHQMFNVSALLLDDTHWKCVVTEVVLF